MKKVIIPVGVVGFASLVGTTAQAEEINNEKVIEFRIENLTDGKLGYAQIEIGKGSDFKVTSAELVKLDGSKVPLEIKDGVVDTTVHGLAEGKYTINYSYSIANFKEGAEIGSSILTGEEKPITETPKETVAPKPAETPVDSTPTETKPVETTPKETETPKETKPAEETKPTEETKPVGEKSGVEYSDEHSYGKVIEDNTPKLVGTVGEDILTESFVEARTIKYEDDDTLEKGKEIVVVAGQDGLREKVTTWKTIKGHRTEQLKVEEKVIKEKQDGVIKRGTKVVKSELEKQVDKNTGDIKNLNEKVESKEAKDVEVPKVETSKESSPKETKVPKVKDIEVPKLKTEVEKTEREKADEAFRKLPPEEKAKYIDDTYDIVESAPRQPKVHKPVSPQVESAQLKLGSKEEINEEADKVLDGAKTDEDVLTAASLKQLANADNRDLKLNYVVSTDKKLSSEQENKILENAKKVLPESQVDDFKAYLKEQGKNPDNIDKATLVDSYEAYTKLQEKQLDNVVKTSNVGDVSLQVLRVSDEKVAQDVLEDVEKRVQKGELKGTNTAQLFTKEGVNGSVKVDGSSKTSDKSSSDKVSSTKSSGNVAKASDEPVTKSKQGKLSDTGLGDASTAPFAMVSLALALMLAKRKMDLKKESK